MMKLYMEMVTTIEAMKTRTEMVTPRAVVGILHQGGLAIHPHPHPCLHPPLEARVEQ